MTFVILNKREDAAGFINDLYNLLCEDNVFFFPPSKDFSTKVQRTAAIGALVDYKSGKSSLPYIVLVGYKDSFNEGVLAEELLKKSIISVKVGENVSHEFFKEVLFDSGFTKTDFVSQPGEFAIRGSLIDVFSFGDNQPYRVDFFGDEIESIKIFNTNTQRSEKEVGSLDIFPNITPLIR